MNVLTPLQHDFLSSSTMLDSERRVIPNEVRNLWHGQPRCLSGLEIPHYRSE